MFHNLMGVVKAMSRNRHTRYGFLSLQPLGDILKTVDRVLRVAELDESEFAGHSKEARDDVEGGMDKQALEVE